jgi:hypothetical protein
MRTEGEDSALAVCTRAGAALCADERLAILDIEQLLFTGSMIILIFSVHWRVN